MSQPTFSAGRRCQRAARAAAEEPGRRTCAAGDRGASRRGRKHRSARPSLVRRDRARCMRSISTCGAMRSRALMRWTALHSGRASMASRGRGVSSNRHPDRRALRRNHTGVFLSPHWPLAALCRRVRFARHAARRARSDLVRAGLLARRARGGSTVMLMRPRLERSAIGLRVARHMDGVCSWLAPMRARRRRRWRRALKSSRRVVRCWAWFTQMRADRWSRSIACWLRPADAPRAPRRKSAAAETTTLCPRRAPRDPAGARLCRC